MKLSRLIKTVVIMVGFGLITTFSNAAPPNKDVNVINTPDVNVVNIPGVTIENGVLEPVPVEIINQSNEGELINIPLMGVFALGEYNLSEFTQAGTPPNIYQVPNGKKLIVQHVSCTTSVDSPGSVNLFFYTALFNSLDHNAYGETTLETYVKPYFAPELRKVSTGVYNNDTYVANHAMLIVIGGSTNSGRLILGGSRTITTTLNYAYCSLTGQLQDL